MVCRRTARVAVPSLVSRTLGSLAVLLTLIAFAHEVRANGRPPVTNGVFFRSADNQTIFVRSTFGLLVSRDDGCSFRWICEQNIGYGGTFDPKYAVATDGTIFATTFLGLRVSRDGGCSFTTATSELPAGDPGRIAELWVDALDIAANGDIWVATADSGKPNNIYRSIDNGVTFAPRGMVSPTIWWKSVEVAPSDPMRVYISGYEVASPSSDAMGSPRAHLLFSNDTGQNWTPVTLSGVQFGAMPVVMVAAVDPADPLRIYVISVESNGANGDRLYRSLDGGMTLTEVLATTERITDIVIRDATTVFVASAGGAFRSDDGGQTFAPLAGAPRLGCLGKRPDGTLIGCGANWDPDFMAVGESPDAAQWQKIFRFVELAGAVSCPAGTPGHDVCDQQFWPGMQEQFGATGPKDPACAVTPPVDMPSAPGKSGGCCDSGSGAPLGALLLGASFVLLGLRRRSCCGPRERRTS